MLLVGLTGGIGSGKSTVARMLQERGAVVFSADAFSREAVAPGTAGFDAVVRRFGEGVVAPDGSVDRAKLAAIVFADAGARGDLEAIIHPVVAARLGQALDPFRDSDRIVVYDTPLLVETGLFRECDVVVVVASPVEAQVERVAAHRSMAAEEVRARIAAQASPERRAEVADVVLDNEGTPEELERQVEQLWERLRARAGGRT